MGAIRKFNEDNSAEFVKPSELSEFGVVHIEYAQFESWCDNPIIYFTRKGEQKQYKSIANYQITKICETFPSEMKKIEIDDYVRFIVKESKSGKKYNWFVLQ